MSELTFQLNKWKQATGALPWGVQKQFLETLITVSQGKTTLVYGADYNGSNMPCLVNANANVLASLKGEGGYGKPSRHFGNVVASFDSINHQHYYQLMRQGFSPKHGVVHPETATLLIEHFGDIKTVKQAIEDTKNEEINTSAVITGNYREPTDAELWTDWYAANREVTNARARNTEALYSQPPA